MSFKGATQRWRKMLVRKIITPSIISTISDNLTIMTQAVNKCVRINSRTVTGVTTESIIGMQCKPRAGDIRAAGIYGAEFEPGINEGIAGTSIISVASRPVIKASVALPAGNLSGDVRAFEASVGAYADSSRVIGGTASCLWCDNNMHGAVTGGIFPIHVPNTHGGNVVWSGLAKIVSDGQIANIHASSGVALPGDVGWIRVKVGANFYKIPLYNN